MTMRQLIKMNKDSGSFWFSAGAMGFFNTVIPKQDPKHLTEDIWAFVTRESYDNTRQGFTVRLFNEHFAQVEHFLPLMVFETKREAFTFQKDLQNLPNLTVDRLKKVERLARDYTNQQLGFGFTDEQIASLLEVA